jgi:hypothetical protein
MEQLHGICWEQLVDVEPELVLLLRQARAVGACCKNTYEEERGWSQFKQPIAALVGFFGKHREHPLLGTRGAYETVYWKLHNALVGDCTFPDSLRFSHKRLTLS